jgi:hypothetical protein
LSLPEGTSPIARFTSCQNLDGTAQPTKPYIRTLGEACWLKYK